MVQSRLILRYKRVTHYFLDKNDSIQEVNNLVADGFFHECEQVHGDKVIVIKSKRHRLIKGCDGLITQKPFLLKIRTADCLPIFFFAKDKHYIAAIHAGCKGIFAGIIENTVKKMQDLGCGAENLVVAVGPHIRSCCYQVPFKRIADFREKFPYIEGFEVKNSSHWFLDLEKVVQGILFNCGILKDHLDIIPECTCCNLKYFSLRREGQKAGRMYNLIRLN